jgi:NAD(P)-dependent dehydrogenase (short-subunit alcohol dehydrogenase family)
VPGQHPVPDHPEHDVRHQVGRRAYFAQAAQALPARRIATAEDVAAAVVLAATNPNLTGTVIQSDGGARLVSIP